MTMAFISLIGIQFFKAYNFRSDRHSALRHPFANRWLNLAVFSQLLVLIGLVYVPFAQQVFGTYALSLLDWVIVGVFTSTVSGILELAKLVVKKTMPDAFD